MERYHVLLGELGFDSCVAIAARYVPASGAPLTKETLYPALHTVVQRHAALGVQIAPGADPRAVPKYVCLSEVDLDAAVEFLEDDAASVDELLQAQLVRPFAIGTSAPLWRLTVANGRMVVFASHHVIADGQSGPALHAALLAALNDANTGLPSNSRVPVLQSTLIHGPTEAYTDISLSWSSLLHELYKVLAPKSWLPSATAWTGNNIPSTPSIAMNVRCWEISAAQTVEILKRCRENKTTLTAFLHTLLVGVLSRVLQETRPDEVAECKTINVAVPVSLRRYTGVPPLDLCDQVSTVHLFSPILPLLDDGKDFSWEATRRFGAELQRNLPSSPELLGEMRMLFRLGIAESYFRGMLGKKRTSGFALSNLGRFPVAKTIGEKWSLEGVYFAQCDVMRGAAIKVNIVGSPDGATNVAFSWGKASLDEDLANMFIMEMKATLDAMLGL